MASRLSYYRFLVRYLSLVAFKNKTLGATAEHQARKYGSAPFLRFEDEAISFAEFNRLANRRAHFFRQQGVGKGDVVCLLMENRPEYLTTLVGIAKLGAVSAAINHNLKGQALLHSLRISGGHRLILGAECAGQFREVQPQADWIRPDDVFVDTRWPGEERPLEGSHDLNALLAEASEADPPAPRLNSKDLFMYIYTSGTTGLPKAARINHYRWYAAGLAMGDYALQARADDTLYCPLPLYHSNGALIAFGAALVNGARLAVARRFSATRFWEDVRRHDATAIVYIGELLRYLINNPPDPRDTDHRVTRVLGNGLRPDIWETFRERFGIPHIREFYASTEGNAVTVNVDDVSGSVGDAVLKLSDNMRLVRYDVERDDYIRDERGFCIRCRPWEAGELLGEVKATTPFYGYSSERESEKKLLRNVFRTGDVFFRTGDLLKQDERGFYYFIDRIGDTFRWKGENVSTHEVAEILTQFPGLAFCNVYGVAVPGAEGRTGMAALTMEAEQAFDPEAFYRFATGQLAPYAVPSFLRLLSGVEMTGTFKIRKVDLQEQGYDPHRVGDALFYKDAAAGTYRPLTRETYERIRQGGIAF